MDTNKLKVIIIAVLSLFAALYLGFTAATAQLETILWVLGGVILVVCLLLGRRVFLLLPLMTSLNLVLPLPGNFSTGLIFQGIVLAFLAALFLMRRLPIRGGFSELEGWCLLLIATVVQVYLRNPVGLNIFGSGSVGAKPYAIFAITTVTALVVSYLVIDPKDLKMWVRMSFAGSILNFAVGALGWISPTFGYYLGASFSTDVSQEVVESQATRISFVRNLAVAVATWVSSRISPLRACFHPFWVILILLSLLLAGVSGYRSQIALVGFIYFLGVCYRGGIVSVTISLLAGGAALLLLSFVNLVAPLPANIQRSLSFLPGTWEASLKEDGQYSTEWRVEMWKEALTTNKWIANKVFGDGLGFTVAELNRMKGFMAENMELSRARSGLTIQQETMMINGDYHSGPVQTIRATGYVGLTVLLLAMIRLAVHAHRQILRCKGTEWHSVALFIGIPIIATPFMWALVFGTFQQGIAGVLFGAAVIRMMDKNIPLPKQHKSQSD